MKRWDAKDWVAFILACTVPFFLVMWVTAQIFAAMTDVEPDEAEVAVEKTKMWIGLITSIATGLLVYISNNRKNGTK